MATQRRPMLARVSLALMALVLLAKPASSWSLGSWMGSVGPQAHRKALALPAGGAATAAGAQQPREAPQLRPLTEEKAAFLQRHGAKYGYGGWMDRSWHEEVGSRFAREGLLHYLDFTASALFTTSHLKAATQLLLHHTLSNPHSRNPSSLASSKQLEAASSRVLRFFNAPEDEYVVVWTKGATEALKTVGEYFPWSSPAGWAPPRHTPAGGYSDDAVGAVTACGAVPASASAPSPQASHFVYLRSNHKSVLGIGGYAEGRGATLACVDEAGMSAWLDSGSASASSSSAAAGGNATATFSLVAYPAKDNYEGRLYPLAWIDKIHAKSTRDHRWLVVLDAAAHAPTHELDLSAIKPDFVPVSFYKIFGYPTGLGALIARKDSMALLHKLYFGGGSVVDATAEDVWRVLAPAPEGFEDGTIDFLGIAQLQHGFEQLDALGGIKAIEAHVQTLQAWGHETLSRLRHSNGAPLLRVFGRHGNAGEQSCIFQLLVLQPDGSPVSPARVETEAGARGIAVRTGCMCNPGQCLFDVGIRPEEHRAAILNRTDTSSGFLEVERPAPDGSGRRVRLRLPNGSVRVSLGYLSTFEDVYALASFFLAEYKDAWPDAPSGATTRDHVAALAAQR